MNIDEAWKVAREKAFQIVEKTPRTTLTMVNAITNALLAAAAQQREEDAQIADACSAIASNSPDIFEQGFVAGWIRARDNIAAAIREQKP